MIRAYRKPWKQALMIACVALLAFALGFFWKCGGRG